MLTKQTNGHIVFKYVFNIIFVEQYRTLLTYKDNIVRYSSV